MKDFKIWFIAAIIVVVLMINPKKKNIPSPKVIVFIGGVDDQNGYKNLSQQIELIKKGIKKDFKIIGHRYTDGAGALASIRENPDAIVILFSAGGRYAEDVAKLKKELGKNLSDIYVAEPYFSDSSSGQRNAASVRNAVSMGVPAKNIYTGSYKGTGLGIVNGANRTPDCSPQHWCSVTKIAEML